MKTNLGIALGAGIASALLFTVVTTGSALAVVLYFAAPLPILIAAIGWSHRAGFVAALVAGASIAFVLSPRAGIVFTFGVGLPSWWFAYLLMLARETENGVEWFPLGRVLASIAYFSAAMTVIGMFLVAGDYATLVATFEGAVRAFRANNPSIFAQMGAADLDPSGLARLMALVAPAISSAVGVMSSVVLLWGAARIVSASGRLSRPWPDLAEAAMPPSALVATGAAILGALVLEGMAGMAARTGAAALGMAYALQGLAVIHAISRGFGPRGLLLGALYAVLLLMPGWPFLALAVLGIAEGFFDFRSRAAVARPRPPSPGD
jgi:hypothetical protein